MANLIFSYSTGRLTSIPSHFYHMQPADISPSPVSRALVLFPNSALAGDFSVGFSEGLLCSMYPAKCWMFAFLVNPVSFVRCYRPLTFFKCVLCLICTQWLQKRSYKQERILLDRGKFWKWLLPGSIKHSSSTSDAPVWAFLTYILYSFFLTMTVNVCNQFIGISGRKKLSALSLTNVVRSMGFSNG